MGIESSTRKYVVKRFPHASHWRRRRTLSPSSDSRESMTAVSSALQYGHFMGVLAGNDALRAGGLPHAVHRMATAQPGHFGRHALEGLVVLRRVQHIGDEIGEVLRLGEAKTARRHRRRADADAAGDERLLRIVRDGVLVYRDVRLAQRVFRVLARDVPGTQVEQEHMALGAPGHDAQPAGSERLRHLARIGDHLLLIGLELGFQRLLERHRLGGDDVHQRAALQAGEDGGIDRLFMFGLHQDEPAARAAQGLVRRAGDEVGDAHRARIFTGGDKPGVMRHVHHEVGADLLRHAADALEVYAQRIGGCAGENQLGLVLARNALERGVIDLFLVVQPVAQHVEPPAAHVHGRAVRKVAAHRQRHAEKGIPWLHRGEEHRLIGLRARAGLHVGGIVVNVGTEQLSHAVDRKLLCDIDEFAAAVIALARIALGVLVGELRPLSGEHRRARVVLRGDQLDVVFLALIFLLDRRPQFRVDFMQRLAGIELLSIARRSESGILALHSRKRDQLLFCNNRSNVKELQVSHLMLRVIALASVVAVAGCHRQADAPGDAPSNLKVTPGEALVTVSWDQQADLTYWIFFQAGSTVTAAAPGVPLIFDAHSPRVVFPLANGTQYAFVMNSTNRDSRGGPSTPVALAVPRLAGASWTPGVPLGSPPRNLNGVSYGAALNRIVAVGDAGTIFAG